MGRWILGIEVSVTRLWSACLVTLWSRSGGVAKGVEQPGPSKGMARVYGSRMARLRRWKGGL